MGLPVNPHLLCPFLQSTGVRRGFKGVPEVSQDLNSPKHLSTTTHVSCTYLPFSALNPNPQTTAPPGLSGISCLFTLTSSSSTFYSFLTPPFITAPFSAQEHSASVSLGSNCQTEKC